MGIVKSLFALKNRWFKKDVYFYGISRFGIQKPFVLLLILFDRKRQGKKLV